MADHSHTENPQIVDGYTPLRKLIQDALREYGEFSVETIEADVSLMVLNFANQIVREVWTHPYATAEDAQIKPYTSLDDVRPIDDMVMISGLLARVLKQQRNYQSAQVEFQNYYRTLNQMMWFKLNGNTAIRMRQVDDGTHPRSSEYNKTSPINGLKES